VYVQGYNTAVQVVLTRWDVSLRLTEFRAKFLVSRMGSDDRLLRLMSHLGNVGKVEQFAILPLSRRYLSKDVCDGHIRIIQAQEGSS